MFCFQPAKKDGGDDDEDSDEDLFASDDVRKMILFHS
jgi:hypothetical protein